VCSLDLAGKSVTATVIALRINILSTRQQLEVFVGKAGTITDLTIFNDSTVRKGTVTTVRISSAWHRLEDGLEFVLTGRVSTATAADKSVTATVFALYV